MHYKELREEFVKNTGLKFKPEYVIYNEYVVWLENKLNDLHGVFSPDTEELVSIHLTKKGAENNKMNFENIHGEGYFVQKVIVNP